MITLTTPPEIRTVLGGNATAAYDRFVLSQITHDPLSQSINGLIRLTSTGAPSATPIAGRFKIIGHTLDVEVEQIGFVARVSLEPAQRATVDAMITSAQSAIEEGLVALGVVDGVQTDGV